MARGCCAPLISIFFGLPLMIVPAGLTPSTTTASEKYVSALYPRLGETVRLRLREPMTRRSGASSWCTFPDGEQALPDAADDRRADRVMVETSLRVEEPLFTTVSSSTRPTVCGTIRAGRRRRRVPFDATDFRILVDHQTPEWLDLGRILPDLFRPVRQRRPGQRPTAGGV